MYNYLKFILLQWQLSKVRPLTNFAIANNYVAIVYSDHFKKDVVLKIGPKKIIDSEIQALQYFQGDACVKLLQFDQECSDVKSALLLEYIQPGTSLKDLFLQNKEDETIEIFVQVFKKLHKNCDKKLDVTCQTIAQRINLLHMFQSKNEHITQLLLKAAQLADKLIATQGKQYLLHGDLHHENILQRISDNISRKDKGRKPDDVSVVALAKSEAESDVFVVALAKSEDWVMIDPQGVVGELEYEVGAFIRNPLFELLDQDNIEALMLYRFERLSQLLNLDKQRMIDWTFVQAVLAACYSEQDKNVKAQNYFLAVAQLIAKVTDFEYRLDISVATVAKLIVEQFPQWADLPIRPVAVNGWDNKTFHLGDEMSIRLPSGQEYAAQVAKEQKWLPILAAHISIPISQPIAMGKPSKNYPFHWSVYRWIDGQSPNTMNVDVIDLKMIAVQLAQFLHELHKIDTTGGPVTDRGGSPIFYDDEARSTMIKLQGVIDIDVATAVWDEVIKSRWNHNPVWAHGDFSSGNILIKDNRLCAVIDFGSITIGDPACDLVIAWTFLQGDSRYIFKNCMNLDVDTWARARGWALWKAMITLASIENKSSLQALEQLRIIEDILNEFIDQ